MSAASDKQYETLRGGAWLRDLRVKGAAVFRALADAGVEVNGVLVFDVTGVPVTVKSAGGDAFVSIGTADDGRPLYEWRIPLSWLTETPA